VERHAEGELLCRLMHMLLRAVRGADEGREPLVQGAVRCGPAGLLQRCTLLGVLAHAIVPAPRP
jgi:hypothetical protein